jgi:hypothetical protein
MRPLPPRVAAIVAAITLCIASGCLRSQDTRFYVLTPVTATERPTEASSGRGPVVGLRPVGMPDQLDRPQIVTRVGGNMLQLAQFDYWAASLRDNFSRVLAEDLAILTPADRVALFPWSREVAVDYEVSVEVVRFEGALGGESTLVADWTIMKRARGAKDMATTGRSNHSEATGGSYSDVAASGSRLIAGLSRDIAKALNAMPR